MFDRLEDCKNNCDIQDVISSSDSFFSCFAFLLFKNYAIHLQCQMIAIPTMNCLLKMRCVVLASEL